ncbi:hypothetical protein EV385_6626 [Krasilnikovia cinnamomea]|uniref:Uncharacterized protein n=1 Tax=Krasilnikovia cinnamomea TaxID=349313 RepID=A0A4Q7Z7Q9_9ACTN|nr:hypothetical protein [Krasilnikovia cinnamomea]RZU46552.1 hypothetical protein EV385_6626 [Krasilnikovia cinnamomea]
MHAKLSWGLPTVAIVNIDEQERWPSRHGEPWTEEDYARLMRCIAAGASLVEVAGELGRSSSGVQGQLRRLVPAEVPARTRVEWLRAKLAEDGFDWRAALRASATTDASVVWLDDDDNRVRAGWSDRVALPTLAARLQRSESAVVARLIGLGLAANVVEVVDRIGASADGAVEARARLARAERVEAVYVVVVETGDRPQVSVHHSREHAEQHRQEVAGPAARAWVLRRLLDGRDTWSPDSPQMSPMPVASDESTTVRCQGLLTD